MSAFVRWQPDNSKTIGLKDDKGLYLLPRRVLRGGVCATRWLSRRAFSVVPGEWSKFKHIWAENTAESIVDRLRKDIFPSIGTRAPFATPRPLSCWR